MKRTVALLVSTSGALYWALEVVGVLPLVV